MVSPTHTSWPLRMRATHRVSLYNPVSVADLYSDRAHEL